jgi:hypothetical protein
MGHHTVIEQKLFYNLVQINRSSPLDGLHQYKSNRSNEDSHVKRKFKSSQHGDENNRYTTGDSRGMAINELMLGTSR